MRRALIVLQVALVVGVVPACKEEAAPVESKPVVVIREIPCAPCPACPVAEAQGEKKAGKSDAPGPVETVLYHLTDIYEPVLFKHEEHVEYEENCEACHHHSSEVDPTPPCRECHGAPFRDDLAQPGLKGAYHRQCMGCHKKMGSGPLTCGGCHKGKTLEEQKKVELARRYVPAKMELGHLSDKYAPAPFDHAQHVDSTEQCSDCHHHDKDYEVAPPCRSCHNTADTPAGERRLGLKDAYHKQCIGCHKEADDGPTDCDDCHEEKE
jgi:predicted CXXCH cytochrome family protein